MYPRGCKNTAKGRSSSPATSSHSDPFPTTLPHSPPRSGTEVTSPRAAHPGTPAGAPMLTAGEGHVDAVGRSLVEQARLRRARTHVHLLDAAVYGTCKEQPRLPGLLCLLTPPPPAAARRNSPQSTKRRGSARAVAAAPSARSRTSGDSTMVAAAAVERRCRQLRCGVT